MPDLSPYFLILHLCISTTSTGACEVLAFKTEGDVLPRAACAIRSSRERRAFIAARSLANRTTTAMALSGEYYPIVGATCRSEPAHDDERVILEQPYSGPCEMEGA